MFMPFEPKCKQCRREGTKLFLKGEKCFGTKCPVVRRTYPPGVHGPAQTRTKKLMGFARQLREKQKARRVYRLKEYQFRNYVEAAQRRKGDSGQFLKNMLEMRLDNVVYRTGFATSRDQARQLVGHGLIRVNDKKVNIPSYQVSVGDALTFKDATLNSKIGEEVKKRLEKLEPPSWITINPTRVEAKVTSTPREEDMGLIFDTQPIIEYYSR
ncbi:MAG TPA: 30S ribosomal protein S4 [Candidatus Magasanikbacteria bacterium]|nr:30S ribosomal protein S4 [Candidatus Magasanikbacteria bacterium]